MRCASTSPTATAWRAAPSTTPSCTWRRSSRRCSPTITWRKLCALTAAALFAALLAACGAEGPKFKSTDITGADFGRELALTGHDGKPRTLADFRGKLVVLVFGYTYCPDVCPTTLVDLASVMKALGKDAERVQVLFVTVDPERDTREVLAQYVTAFDPRFLGLYGDAAATARVAKEFRIFYEKRPGATPSTYSVDHSAQCYVLDGQGKLRLFVRQERIASDLAEDLRTLLASAGGR
jgi:protein SCO1/2